MISVIIPVHNGERYLGAAIESALKQTARPAEILVVDDGSTDRGAAIAASYGAMVRCLRQENQGQAAARNLGVGEAKGDLLAFLDADDLWLVDHLYLQQAVLAADPDLEGVTGWVENFISPELSEAERRPLLRAAGQSGERHLGALLIRRSAFLRIGWFDPHWRFGDALEWWERARRLNFRCGSISELVLQRRLHAGNLTRNTVEYRREMMLILQQRLAGRRQSGQPV